MTRTVRAVGDASIALAVATTPERFTLVEHDADVVLASLTALDDDTWIPAPRFAPLVEVEPTIDAALVQITVEHTGAQLDGFVEALAVARKLAEPIDALGLLHRSDACVVASSGVVTLTCVRSAIGRDALHARAVAREARVDIELDASAPAQPARIATFDERGEHVAPLVHQSAHRITLRRVADGLELAYTVADLRHDLSLARSVL